MIYNFNIKNWCIKGSMELGNWQLNDIQNKTNCTFFHRDLYYYPITTDLLEWDFKHYRPYGYKEITFEQFEIYILKKNIRKPFKLNRNGKN